MPADPQDLETPGTEKVVGVGTWGKHSYKDPS